MFIEKQLHTVLNLKISKDNLVFNFYSFFICSLVFIFSLYLLSFYVHGDQYIYNKVYNQMPNFSFLEAKKYYKHYLTSSELVHFIFIFIFSRITEKALFISFFNSILAYSVLILFRRWGANLFISAIIILTNYYLFILYLPAERLKFGVILFLFALLQINNYKKFIGLSILSILGHFQILLLYVSISFKYFFTKIKLLFFEQKLSSPLLVLLFTLLLVFFFFRDPIVLKLTHAYSNSNGLLSVYKPFVFFLASIIYAKDKVQIVYFFIPLIVASFFLGDSRLNMFCFFIFLYSALPVRGGFNLGILLTIVYFGFKNFLFIDQVIKYGNGFYL